MKTIFLSIAIALGSGVAHASNGTDPNVRILDMDNKKFGVIIEDDLVNGLIVRFVDSDGFVLHKTRNIGTMYSRTYDLSVLPAGNYVLEIEDEASIQTLPIRLSKTDVEVSKSGILSFAKPQITGSEKGIILNVPPHQGDVDVRIYDSSGKLLHTSIYGDQEYINTLFNLTELGSGTYRVAVQMNRRSFSETITLH